MRAGRTTPGGRTVSFRPPPDVVRPDGLDPLWLDRVEHALAPLGVDGLEVSSASLEAAFLALTTPDATPDASPDPEPIGASR